MLHDIIDQYYVTYCRHQQRRVGRGGAALAVHGDRAESMKQIQLMCLNDILLLLLLLLLLQIQIMIIITTSQY